MKWTKLRTGARWRAPGLAMAALACLTSTSLFAATVAGTANIDGSATVTGTSISFFDNLNNPGQFSVARPNNGSYTGLTGGTLMNLGGGPITGPFSLIGFAVFNVPTGNVIFDLQNIAPGVGTLGACASNTVGNVCTPTGSPFTLTQLTSNTVQIGLVLNGVAHTGTAASGTSPTTGIFTAQRVPGTITEILATVQAGGSIQQSFSATFSSTAVPEPATIGLIGGALLALGMVRIRKVRS